MSKPKIQPSLFDDLDNQTINENENIKVNLIKINTEKELSKEEINFNKLSEKLFKKQAQYEMLLENEIKIRQYYSENVSPILQQIANVDADILKIIFKNYIELNPIKLSKNEKDKADCVIGFFLLEVDSLIDDDPELLEILNYFNTEILKKNKNNEYEENENVHDFNSNELNKKLMDMLNNDFFSEEDINFIKEHGEEEFLNKLLKNLNKNSPQKKKSKKQIEKELQKELEQKEKENLKNKSLKSIYINLAKLLHPDTELDEENKLIKEEIMKKVTIAYNNKDIFTLLKLEMEWIKKEEKKLENLPNSTIKLYNEILSEQIKELERNIYTITESLNLSFNNSNSPIQSKDIKRYFVGILKEKYEIEVQYQDNMDFLNSLKKTKFTFAIFKKHINQIYNDFGL